MIDKIKKMMGKKDKSSVKDAVEELEGNGLNGQEEGMDNENIDDKATESSEMDEKDMQIAELKDKYLRLASDFENYKRRAVREKLEMMGSAAKATLSALLPVLDDFDRAKKIAEDESSEESFSEGVELVYHKLHNTLEQKGLQVMESNNEVFDPELHEAITEIPAPSEDLKGKIIDTVEKGYYLNDKILRYAKVVVGK